jgi:hypothetical protein
LYFSNSFHARLFAITVLRVVLRVDWIGLALCRFFNDYWRCCATLLYILSSKANNRSIIKVVKMNMLPTAAESTLLDRANSSPPAWAFEKLKAWDDSDAFIRQPFIVQEDWTANQTINVFHVIGTRNSSYFGWNWLEFLNQGKRMDANLKELSENPDYYFAHEVKLPVMSFVGYDSTQLFVDSDGNHRTCIARFLFGEKGCTQLAGVDVRILKLDEEFLTLFQEVQRVISEKRLNTLAQASRRVIERQDSSGWKVDRFEPFITLNTIGKEAQEFNKAQTKDWLAKARRSWWQRLTG